MKQNNIYALLENTFRFLYMRSIIMEEAEKVEKTQGKKVVLQSVDNLVSSQDVYDRYEKEMKKSLSKLIGVTEQERLDFREYILTITENLRFHNFEEKYASDENVEYSLIDDRLKNISRDELGKILLQMAKEEIEKFGSVPEKEALQKIYEDKFGAYMRYCDLFDLELLIRENSLIHRTAEEKKIENIVRLTNAFEEFLKQKREEKDKRTKDFISKKLEKIAK